ncbi:hypothetical protein ES332_A13G245900v1 [Gossypium tomentosum]|uniref:Uncharacterized protein n=1 Tax=Gossypium tomentosum TaxID=34277 RepID=A0A5D2MS15_GOSTO|nr:hypothetical protein ES332_A13G245900v1 [Gossypium tomentosum]
MGLLPSCCCGAGERGDLGFAETWLNFWGRLGLFQLLGRCIWAMGHWVSILVVIFGPL